jgi:hypothetical protein
MKKLLLCAGIILSMSLFTGCGQDVNMTVYNHSGVVPYLGEYIGITADYEGGGAISFLPTTSTLSDDGVTTDNSIVFKVKENKQVGIKAFGAYYVTDSSGNTSLAAISLTTTATVYGGFPTAPAWYAAVFVDGITVYHK